MKGKLITGTLDYDGGRKVTAYVPPRMAEAIIYCGDGQLIPQWGEDLEDLDLTPVMIVGTHRLEDEMDRLKEYTPVFDQAIYEAHEDFFVRDVRDWIKERSGMEFPREKTAVLGVSAGAELALSIGTRHPDIYGAILAASPGAGYRPPPTFGKDQPNTYLVAGKQEQFFLDNAKRWYDALKDGGVETVMHEREGEHGGAFWGKEFPLMIAWAFGRS